MAISREEISNIAQEAADKVTISKRCKGLGEMLLDTKQDLWNAMDHLRVSEIPYSLDLAKIWAEGAKKRYMTPLWTSAFTTEELVLLNAPIEKGLKLIKEGKGIEAAFAFEEARNYTHELLFQKVVECACGEAKAIEEKLGDEALKTILEKGPTSTPESSITEKGEWTYIKYGVEEIRVKEYEGGLEVQRVLPGPPVSQDDFDAAVEIAQEKRRAGELGIDKP